MKYLILLLVIVLNGCAASYDTHCKLADQLAMNFAMKLQASNNLTLSGYGGAMMGNVKVINLAFDTEECMNVDQIRRLIVHKAEELIYAMNSDMRIRPYLHDYPCTVKNIHLSIGYNKKGKTNSFYPHVSSAQIVRGEILYLGFAEESDWFFTDPPSEKYEEALRIVQEEDARNSFSFQ